MKLHAETYVSPLPHQGTFQDVYIQDLSMTHKRFDNYIEIGFEMYYMRNDSKLTLTNTSMGFLGLESEPNEKTSNRVTLFSIPNPDYYIGVNDIEYEFISDPENDGEFIEVPIEKDFIEERITISLFNYLYANNGIMPEDYIMVDYGYPTYEKVMMYFTGGTLVDPEIIITDPLAIGFLMNNLIMNGEPVKNQFTIILPEE